jgi:hypothetical protein
MPALNTVNGHVVNGVQVIALPDGLDFVQNRTPIGGSPIIPLLPFQTLGVVFNVYADRERVYSANVADEKTHKLPSGYKATVFQFEIIGNARVYQVEIAETGKELGTK